MDQRDESIGIALGQLFHLNEEVFTFDRWFSSNSFILTSAKAFKMFSLTLLFMNFVLILN